MSSLRRSTSLALLGLLVALALPRSSVAGATGHVHALPPATAKAAMGGDAVLLDNGLYRVVTPDGYVFTTHGPDTTALIEDGHGRSLGPGDPERNPVCSEGYTAHVLYGYPGLVGTNRLEEVKEEIRAHIRRMNAVINDSSLASGGPTADLKVLCDEQGNIRVDSFSNNPPLAYGTFVFDAARKAGFDDPNIDYIIFYDDDFPGICGLGQFSDDTSAGETNKNNDGGYGITYQNCWFSRTPLHENGHNQGAVQTGAPNEDGTSHCTEQQDIMCYPSISTQCADQWYDCGFDTYFDAAPEPGEWLASHWNIGSRVNRYIVFGDAPQGPEASPQPDPTPEVEPEPEPEVRTVERDISFSVNRKGVGTGSLTSSDPEAEVCTESVQVLLQRRNDSGRWRTVSHTTASPTYRIRATGPGLYRAKATQLDLDDGTQCLEAISLSVRVR